MIREPLGRRMYLAANTVFLLVLAFACLFPVLHILAMSLSATNAVDTGKVSLWPVKFTTYSYSVVFYNRNFLGSFGVSVQRVALGLVVNMFFILTMAYPLAKENRDFHGRTVYAWILMFCMIFSGGLIPMYIIIMRMKLTDSIWALILPGAVPIWNTVLMMNFFRSLPREIEESAFMDGAGHITVLLRLSIPLSAPAIATISLFCIVNHWNAWFDGMIYMNTQTKYPLQTFLRLVNAAMDQADMSNPDLLQEISPRTIRCAQVFIAMVPVLCVYPFLQKYFTKGIVMGSVKG